MVKGRFNRPAPNPPLPCPLPYDATGRWTTETTAAARQCVLHNLERDLSWWRKQKSECGAMRPDIDGTLCRVRAQHPRSVLTNMMLLRSVNGRLQAMILQDPGDERGPMRHWPGRPVAAIQQLAAVQQRIDDGRLPPLPNFTAILNPHDSPYQFARFNWCGLAPVLSNSRVSNENRDLMMPDFSFAPFSYLTNIIDANLSAALSVPRGWPVEREAIYRSGQRLPYSAKRRVLFWRGGETHEQRRVYSKAVSGGELRLPSAVQQDVKLCGAHCSLEDGVPPEAWCDRQQLLSLPGHSFAVGFKYTLLCSSLVVRGSHAAGCDEASCPRVYEQFWHAGLSAAEHFASSRSVAPLQQRPCHSAPSPQRPFQQRALSRVVRVHAGGRPRRCREGRRRARRRRARRAAQRRVRVPRARSSFLQRGPPMARPFPEKHTTAESARCCERARLRQVRVPRARPRLHQ